MFSLAEADADTRWLYPCTSQCRWNRDLLLDWGPPGQLGAVTQRLWDCANEATAHPGGVAGQRRYQTRCRLLVGNGRLDKAAGETCDPGVQPASEVHADDGWKFERPPAAAALWQAPAAAGAPVRLVDGALLWAQGATAAGSAGVGEASADAALRTTWGCYMQKGAHSASNAPNAAPPGGEWPATA